MPIQLFGDPYGQLQGSAPSLQGGSPTLQGGASPQPAYAPAAPAPRPAPAPVRAAAPRQAAPAPARPTAQPIALNPLYAPFVGTRPSPSNPGVLEYFRKDTNQALTPNDLFGYLSAVTGTSVGSFEQINNTRGVQSLNTGSPQITPARNLDPYQSLAEAAGQAGLSLDDYVKLYGAQNGITQADKDAIRQKLGIPDLENSIFAPPSKTTEQLYKDAYSMAGLAFLKKRIQNLDNEINSKRQQYTDTEGKVNENPWLSEASRVGRVSRLNDKAQADVNNLINQQAQLKDLYNSGVGEVSALVSMQSADFNDNQQRNAQKLQYLLAKAEEQIQQTQSEKTSGAYSYLPDYVKAKAKAQKPETIGSNETGYYRWNPETGTFEQVIAPSITPNYQANPLTGELFDTKTGLSRGGNAGGGTNYGAGLTFNTNAQGMRTDRHNNPTAFTTDIAKQAGLQEGVDYVAGDPFPNNPNLRTAKLLGDPIAQTIQVIDRIGFFTQGGQQRWTHTAIPQSQWNAMSYDQKAQVVARMYQKEGGNGSLVQGTGGNDIIGTLAQQVMQNPALLQSLPSAQQTAVIARLAQIGQRVPDKPLSAEASKLAGIVQTLPNEIEQLKAAFRKDYKGSLRGIVLGTNRELVKLLDQVADKVGRLRSGGAINKDEEARFKRQIASFMDIPFGNADSAIAALDGVLNEARTVAQGIQPGQQMPSSSGGNANLSDLNFRF